MNNIENSKFSIDSFRALDTTRIFVAKSSTLYDLEDEYIHGFSRMFVLNRVQGGRITALEIICEPVHKKNSDIALVEILIMFIVLVCILVFVILQMM